MAYKVVVTPGARKQIEEAVTYYMDHASKKVALSFLQKYKKSVSEILKIRYFQIFYFNFRARLMEKFPYMVFYTIDEERHVIIIKAVFHTSQHPDKYPTK